MDTEKETKEIEIFFIYSDELKTHHFGICFDDSYPARDISTQNCGKIIKFELQNNEKTNVKLVAEPHPKITPIGIFAETEFSFKEGVAYNLQFVISDDGDRQIRKIHISEKRNTIAPQD